MGLGKNSIDAETSKMEKNIFVSGYSTTVVHVSSLTFWVEYYCMCL